MREPVSAFVGIGANLGDAAQSVRQAIEWLGGLPQTRLVQASSMYRTEPREANGPDYVNAVAQVETRLDAMALLGQLQALESRAGRERPYRNAPRTLDLDLLLFGSARIESQRLTVPHPRMHERAFVLVPLAEIAPQLVDGQRLRTVETQRVERLQ
jgi:2-amino-4-hydroxy-6-hydroxymethyldihydropteridine diphosphokinase